MEMPCLKIGYLKVGVKSHPSNCQGCPWFPSVGTQIPRYSACSSYCLPIGNLKALEPNPNVALTTLPRFRRNKSLQIQKFRIQLKRSASFLCCFPKQPSSHSASPSVLSCLQTTCSEMTDGHSLIFLSALYLMHCLSLHPVLRPPPHRFLRFIKFNE